MKTPKTPNRKTRKPACDAVQAFGDARLIPGDESRRIADVADGNLGKIEWVYTHSLLKNGIMTGAHLGYLINGVCEGVEFGAKHTLKVREFLLYFDLPLSIEEWKVNIIPKGAREVI